MPRKNRGFYIWREPRTGVYQVRWSEAGQRRTRSTGTRIEIEAQAYLARLHVELSREEEPDAATVPGILAGWLASRRRIADAPRYHAALIERHLGAEPAATVKPSTVRALAAALAGAGLSPGYVRNVVASLLAALRWAAREGLIERAPTVDRPRGGKPRLRWLAEPEALALLAAADHLPHLHAFIGLALFTAARSGAILDLEWGHVTREAIHYPPKPGGKRRVAVPIAPELRPILARAAALADGPRVVQWRGKPVRRITNSFTEAVRRAGIEHCTPHDLRRTAGSWLLQRGVSLEIVSAILGHSDLRVTREVYAHLDLSHLAPAISKLGFLTQAP